MTMKKYILETIFRPRHAPSPPQKKKIKVHIICIF